MKRPFTGKDVQMPSKHMKGFSTSLSRRETQIRTTVRYRLCQHGWRPPKCCTEAENPGQTAAVHSGWGSLSRKRYGGLHVSSTAAQLAYTVRLVSGVQHRDSNILLLILQPQCPRSQGSHQRSCPPGELQVALPWPLPETLQDRRVGLAPALIKLLLLSWDLECVRFVCILQAWGL